MIQLFPEGGVTQWQPEDDWNVKQKNDVPW